MLRIDPQLAFGLILLWLSSALIYTGAIFLIAKLATFLWSLL